MEGENNNANNTNSANGVNNASNSNSNAQNTTGQNNNLNQGNNGIDYSKIQEMIDGRNAKNEDAVLKSYFQKQGLSEDEMNSAIENFKTAKAEKIKNQNNDFINVQNENKALKSKIQDMQINEKANQIALELGIDSKTVPYLIKMADLSKCVDANGNVLEDNIKTSINAVLEALPQLKNPAQSQNNDNTGFQKIGGNGNSDGVDKNMEDKLKEIFS